MNLKLVPYGNAEESFDVENDVWLFKCQHGEEECAGNLFQTCLIHSYPDVSIHFPVIDCIESDDEENFISLSIQCSNKFNINYHLVSHCMKSRLGNALQHEMAKLTNGLNLVHQYVPLIDVNGQHDESIQDMANENLIKLICNFYQVFKVIF